MTMAATRVDGDPSAFFHAPVMLAEMLAALAQAPGMVFVDATLGGAGHAAALLRSRPEVRLFGFDRDPRAGRTGPRVGQPRWCCRSPRRTWGGWR